MTLRTSTWLLIVTASASAVGAQARQSAPSPAAAPAVIAAPVASHATAQGGAASPATTPPAPGLVTQYCLGCHNDRTRAGELSLQSADPAAAAKTPEVWEKVVRRLRNDSMPPAGRPRPEPAVRNAFVADLEASLDRAAAARPDPGRTAALHRLNRVEYQNAVRDLLSVDMDIATLLPPDGQNFGFDNNGDALSFSPMLLDRYLSVARRVSRLAVGASMPTPVAETYHAPSDLNQDDRLDGLPYGTRGGMLVRHNFPADGEYEFRIRLARNYNFLVVDMFEPHQVEVMVDGERVQLITIAPLDAPPPDPGAAADERGLGAPQPDDKVNFKVPIKAGPRDVAVTFIRRPAAQLVEDRLPFLRGDAKENALHGQPWLGEFTITGPFAPTGVGSLPSRARIFTCQPPNVSDQERCARRILTTLGRRAYRRPVSEVDVAPLMAAFAEGRNTGGGFQAGIELAIQRILVSPAFLFRIESEPRLTAGGAYRLTDIALASRLSFFLWSSLPDDELLTVAEQGRLADPAVLDQQVRRMLLDPRAEALAANFAGQWLELRKLEEAAPDQRTFPNFDRSLRDAFRKETELFFKSILHDDRPIGELLTANYTFMNERLARHYGVNGIYGDRFRRVALPADSVRRGLLGHGSVLTVTSYPNRTSPVLRGVWILDNLLGMPPPPPPPDVPDLEETNHAGKTLSMRERMAQHRANPTCASCHSVMDPLGLSLEHFDATGGFRRRSESGEPIDASGVLPNGAAFDGASGLRAVLVNQIDVFYRTVTEKVLIYALGRSVTAADAPAVRAVLREAAKKDYRAQALITAIVKSPPFLMRRAAPAVTTTAAAAQPR
jgi:hypothetical protein